MASLTGGGRALARVGNRIRTMFARGNLRLVNDGVGLQIVQVSVMKGETRGDLARFQQYGFTSNPLPGAEVLGLFMGGDRARGFIFAIDDRRYRLKNLESGEVALYTDEGDVILLKRDREIEVTSGGKVTVSGATLVRIESGTAIELEAPDVSITGGTIALDATAAITLAAPSVQIQGHEFEDHQHTGVDTGPGNTGGVL